MSRDLPDETWDPLVFLEPDCCQNLLENRKKNLGKNEENTDSSQGIFLKTDCVNEASGSSYIEMGNAKVLCSVYGPREIPRRDDYDFKVANLNCEFRFASFSCFMQRKGTLSQRDQTLDEKNFSSIIEEALKPSILLHKYPKSQIDMYILCIQNDIDSRNIICASVIAASMALANASIELYDLVSSFTYSPINMTVSYMPQLNQVTSIFFSNESNGAFLSTDLFKSHIKESIENCKKVYSFMRHVLLNSNFYENLKNGLDHEMEKTNIS
ncbi:exosome complex component MTR3 [Brachionus plicatilis]|uniref:Exosome complex component MTR3 n=1 Tax=Brachionus plicatilis TaxID=10195 RepID=A0A3M7T2D8_BRAPC|nr:exosome complex component MTR3 [Brachionus plicatilis]